MILTIILILLCWATAAVCNAVMDVLAFKYKTSIFKDLNPSFWNPAISWKNKYKDKRIFKGPAYIGATTFLCFTTDAWHLFQFLSNSFLALSVVIVTHQLFDSIWWEDLALFLALKGVWGVAFEVPYRNTFRIKNQ